MLNVEKIIEWMKLYEKQISENKEFLSDLDDIIGDGDHGNNMNRGMTAVVTDLESKNSESVVDALKLVAMTLMSKVGGASGPLYGTAFLEMAKAAKETSEVSKLIAAGAKGIEKRGGAVAGDKTMLDVWLPISGELEHEILTTEKIEGFVELTKNMQARKGRASYLGERSIGHVDPGAASSGMLFKTLLKVK